MNNGNMLLWGVFAAVIAGSLGCFFPQEYQGSYVGQYPVAGGQPSQHYSEVNIMVDAIPVWGMCHKRLGNNVLLRDRTRTMDCFRCFSLHLHSVNVLQIHTEGLDKCYTNEDAALATCPTKESTHKQLSKEIILYKKPGADSMLQQVLCPINGRFKFTYAQSSGEHTCSETVSEISNCPYGFSLTAKFRQCTFADREISFQCLGDWEGPSGERYLSLLDPSSVNSSGPRYRCAMYKEDSRSGQITLAMSPDSTCSYQLSNSTSGYETLVLTPAIPPSLPVRAQKSNCKFPDWVQGGWQQLMVSGDTLTYTDPHNFQTYTMKCLNAEENHQQERFLVYVRTQCGDETYNCLAMQSRGKLVMEFQMGQYPSLHYNESLCSEQQFAARTWITQGMVKSTRRNGCPVSGDYTGYIPDATGLCAKLSSDCNNPDIMFYTVSNCETKTEVYEEREYRCLGEWEEGGVTYTYTQRRDLPGYQCFVGKITDGKDVFIKEAGDNCVRGMDPLTFGMKMTKQGSCDPGLAADQPLPDPDVPSTSTGPSRLIPARTTFAKGDGSLTTTTKPWKPITVRPTDGSSGSQRFVAETLLTSSAMLLALTIIRFAVV